MRCSPAVPLWYLVLLWVCACSPPHSNFPYAAELDPRGEEYVIGVADGLTIHVWGNGELDTSATVRPDGAFTMPLIGDVAAAGRRVSEVRADVSKRLTAFIRDAGASVMVAVARTAYRVTVSGNVEDPGIFESPTYLKVSEAIVLAGGPNRFASPNDALVIRVEPNGRIKRIPIQLDEILAGDRLEQDIVLRWADRLHVP